MSVPEPKAAELSDDDVVCFCFGTTKKDIEQHFSDPSHNFDTLVEATAVGTKCTACLLDVDLLVHRSSGQHARALVKRKKVDEQLKEKGLYPIDLADSGFFINNREIKTLVRVANYGVMFDYTDFCVPFGYKCELMDANGSHVTTLKGTIGSAESMELDLSKVSSLPAEGWFILTLTPKAPGLHGSIRPQIALEGPTWATSYHSQHHVFACKGRGVLVSNPGGRFETIINVINAQRRETALEFRLLDDDDKLVASDTRRIAKQNARNYDLDEIFPAVKPDQILTLLLLSDGGVRKHVINRHASGSLSVDHFPDFK